MDPATVGRARLDLQHVRAFLGLVLGDVGERLVFAGAASFFVPASQQWIADRIPGARLEVFGANEGGGHFMFMENAPRFNALVREFMGG